MIRREKAKVLTQLPDKTRTDLYVDISNSEEYACAAEDLATYLREYKECTDYEVARKMRMEALVKFMALRSIAAKGKVNKLSISAARFLQMESLSFCSALYMRLSMN